VGVTVLLGLAAAVLYGVADFAGGIASCRYAAITILVLSTPVGAVLMTLLMPAFPGHLGLRTLLFGMAGGASGLMGVILLYHLMTVAPINIVSPVTAVLAASVPILVGVLTGDRPQLSAWFGIALGLLAIVLVSRTTEELPHGKVAVHVLGPALLAGVGFGLYMVFLARAGHGSGLWPLVISRYTSALLVLPLAVGRRELAPVRGPSLWLALLAGTCDSLANMAFLLATHDGLLTLASVLTSLYPATTVVLATVVLKERTSRTQRIGLALAAGAIVLITV
jgi:drug/metabolite transporter (DMT)-like permease